MLYGQNVIAQDACNITFIWKRLNMTYKEWGLTINFNKTEFIAINIDQKFHINQKENVTIVQVHNFKYLTVTLNKSFKFRYRPIISKICWWGYIIGCLNLLWCDKNISLESKKLWRIDMVEISGLLWMWSLASQERGTKEPLKDLEMDYLKRSARVFRL